MIRSHPIVSAIAVVVALAVLAAVALLAARLPAEPLPAAREVVFIVPHADDEVLFAGELLARYRTAGSRVRIVYTTDYAGGRDASSMPGYLRLRTTVRDEVLARLGSVDVTTPAIPDGPVWPRWRRAAAVARWLREPGVAPPGTVIFSIAGDGNSDHAIALEQARLLARDRGQPLYLYWGYGLDRSRLDPVRFGVPVEFTPDRHERAYKRWAVETYERRVYSPRSYGAFKPTIMDRVGDDVVTVLARP